MPFASDPYFNRSGNTYDRTSIGLALVHKPGVDPLTNIKYEGEAQLIPNRALKGAIEEWKQRQLAQPAPAPRSEAKEADNFKDAENRVLKKRQAEMEEDSMLDRVERGGGGGGESGATLDLEAALKAHSEAQLTQKRLEKKGFAVGSRVTWTKETPTSRRGR